MALASRGQRDMDQGPENITDPQELAVVRRQARSIHLQAAAIALLVTLVAVLLS